MKTLWRRLAALLLMVVFALGLLCGCSRREDHVICVRIAHDNNVNTPLHKAFVKYEELVEKASNGEIDVILLPGGQMGGVQDTFEQCRRGDIEMSGSTTSNFATAIPEFAVWESFGLFDDTAHAKRVLESETGQALMEPLERHNLMGIGYMELGFRNFSNSKRSIETLEDLEGLKIRGYNTIQIKAWEALGLNTTSVSWGELFTSLQQKMIDGQECATTSFYTEKFYEAQDYLSLTRHVFTNFLWYANKDFMDSLSEEHRQILMDCAQEAIDYNWALNEETEREILDQLESEGCTVNEVPLEVRREMGQIMNDAVREDIVSLCGQEIYDEVQNTAEQLRQN